MGFCPNDEVVCCANVSLTCPNILLFGLQLCDSESKLITVRAIRGNTNIYSRLTVFSRQLLATHYREPWTNLHRAGVTISAQQPSMPMRECNLSPSETMARSGKTRKLAESLKDEGLGGSTRRLLRGSGPLLRNSKVLSELHILWCGHG